MKVFDLLNTLKRGGWVGRGILDVQQRKNLSKNWTWVSLTQKSNNQSHENFHKRKKVQL